MTLHYLDQPSSTASIFSFLAEEITWKLEAAEPWTGSARGAKPSQKNSAMSQIHQRSCSSLRWAYRVKWCTDTTKEKKYTRKNIMQKIHNDIIIKCLKHQINRIIDKCWPVREKTFLDVILNPINPFFCTTKINHLSKY